MEDPVGWRPLLRLFSGIFSRLWCGRTFWYVAVVFSALLASAAPAELYFATIGTKQQLLVMWLYSGESFVAPLFPNPFGRFE